MTPVAQPNNILKEIFQRSFSVNKNGKNSSRIKITCDIIDKVGKDHNGQRS